jgi:hypothetical protein
MQPNLKIEILIQLCVNGRPLWIKSRPTKPENTYRMTDKEYDRVISAAERELTLQIGLFKKKEEESEPVKK